MMAELIWVLVATFEASGHPVGFYALDSYVQQHALPTKRWAADAVNRALVVPMGALCDSSDDVQFEAATGQDFDAGDARLVALSSALAPLELAALTSKIAQFEPVPTLVVALSGPPETNEMAPAESRGTLTLRLGRDSHVFALYSLMPQKQGLHMSPEGMRKMPEDKDYLRDRETWFQDRYYKDE